LMVLSHQYLWTRTNCEVSRYYISYALVLLSLGLSYSIQHTIKTQFTCVHVAHLS